MLDCKVGEIWLDDCKNEIEILAVTNVYIIGVNNGLELIYNKSGKSVNPNVLNLKEKKRKLISFNKWYSVWNQGNDYTLGESYVTKEMCYKVNKNSVSFSGAVNISGEFEIE